MPGPAWQLRHSAAPSSPAPRGPGSESFSLSSSTTTTSTRPGYPRVPGYPYPGTPGPPASGPVGSSTSHDDYASRHWHFRVSLPPYLRLSLIHISEPTRPRLI
eukprot:387846-Rhodomonas_salina.1